MKKLYTALGALMLSSTFLIGQQNFTTPKPQTRFQVEKTENFSVKKNTINNKAIGAVIYSNNFDTSADWTIDNDGQNGNTFGWTINSTNESWFFLSGGISSSSAGNHAELSNGDARRNALTQKIGVTYTMTTTSPIDLTLAGSGAENCILEFEQYGAKFNDAQDILISTDGITFTKVGDNSDKAANSANNPGDFYPNPELKRIDISPNLNATTAKSVWIRFSWTSVSPSSTNANLWVTYGWYIDDLKIRFKPDNDMRIDASDWGSNNIHYHTIPTTQVQPLIFHTNVTNAGLNEAKNATLNVNITGAASATVSSAPQDIIRGAKDSLVSAPYATPTTTGTYNFTMEVVTDSTDDTPNDNMITTTSFDIVPANGLYSRDQGSNATIGNGGGYNDGVNPATEDFEAGNEFEIFATQDLAGVDVVVSTLTAAGAVIDVVIYSPLAGGWIELSRSTAKELKTSDIGRSVTLPLPSPLTLNANENYVAAVHGWGSNGGSVPEFFYATSGKSPRNTGPAGATSFIAYPNLANPNPGERFFTQETPMVRLNFDLSIVGIEDINIDAIRYNVYPNPSTGVFNINLNSDMSDNVNLTVTNLLGEIIINKTIAVSGKTTETISLANYSKGIYFLTVGNKTKKLIVE